MLETERKLRAGFVADVQIAQHAPRRCEATEIRSQRDSGEFLCKRVRKDPPKVWRVQDAINVVENVVLGDAFIAVMRLESRESGIRDVVYSLNVADRIGTRFERKSRFIEDTSRGRRSATGGSTGR